MGAEPVPVGALAERRSDAVERCAASTRRWWTPRSPAPASTGWPSSRPRRSAGRWRSWCRPECRCVAGGLTRRWRRSSASRERAWRAAARRSRSRSSSSSPVTSGGEVIGRVEMLAGDGEPAPDAGELLHLAALATVTALRSRRRASTSRRAAGGGLIEELADGERGPPRRRARARARLGCDPAEALVVAAHGRDQPPAPGDGADRVRGRPARSPSWSTGASTRSSRPARGGRRGARRPWSGLRRGCGPTARPACRPVYADPPSCGARSRRRSWCSRSLARRAHRGASSTGTAARASTGCCSGRSPRTPRRCAASTRTPSRRVVRYDDQYHSDLLATLEAYLANDCNMNATARAIYAHRHTVAYRLSA